MSNRKQTDIYDEMMIFLQYGHGAFNKIRTNNNKRISLMAEWPISILACRLGKDKLSVEDVLIAAKEYYECLMNGAVFPKDFVAFRDEAGHFLWQIPGVQNEIPVKVIDAHYYLMGPGPDILRFKCDVELPYIQENDNDNID